MPPRADRSLIIEPVTLGRVSLTVADCTVKLDEALPAPEVTMTVWAPALRLAGTVTEAVKLPEVLTATGVDGVTFTPPTVMELTWVPPTKPDPEMLMLEPACPWLGDSVTTGFNACATVGVGVGLGVDVGGTGVAVGVGVAVGTGVGVAVGSGVGVGVSVGLANMDDLGTTTRGVAIGMVSEALSAGDCGAGTTGWVLITGGARVGACCTGAGCGWTGAAGSSPPQAANASIPTRMVNIAKGKIDKRNDLPTPSLLTPMSAS